MNAVKGFFALCLAGLMLAACGGAGEAPPGDAAVLTGARQAPLSEAQRLPADLRALRDERPMATSGLVDATVLMDWAELRYPQYFPGSQPNQTAAPYIYRYYPQTQNYLGVDGDVVRVLGPSFGREVVTVGTLAQLTCQVFPEICVPPVANAGANQTVSTGTLVTLDGRASSSAAGVVLAYQWAWLSRPFGSVASLADATSTRPSFRPDVAGSYVALLRVSDGRNLGTASVIITATAAYTPPVANAGGAQNAFVGAVVSLSGLASTVSPGKTLAYSWTLSKPAGSSAFLDSPSSATPRFTVDVAGAYAATLVVSDGVSSSAAAVATVSVISVVSTTTTVTGSACCRHCSAGKPCGDSCISTSLRCTKSGGCAC